LSVKYPPILNPVERDLETVARFALPDQAIWCVLKPHTRQGRTGRFFPGVELQLAHSHDLGHGATVTDSLDLYAELQRPPSRWR